MTSPALSPASVPGTEARPVNDAERLLLLDALRGFALCGVFVSNVYMWFSGRAFLPRAQLEAALAGASLLDKAAVQVFPVLVLGKFITLFSFLFGLGFAVQMGRAEQRGASITPLHARRLGVLLVLGLAHFFLLWYGDILSTYALLGFGLLLFRKCSNKALLGWAAVLIFLAPVIGAALLQLPQLLGTPEVAAAVAKEAAARSASLRAQALAGFASGSWFESVRGGLRFYAYDFFMPVMSRVLALLGKFLLGLFMGRTLLFHEADQHRAFFRRLLGWGLLFGVLGTGAGVLLQQLLLHKVLTPDTLPSWLPLVMAMMRQVGEVGLSSFYVAGFTLLFQRAAWQRVLSALAPVGRMALTNYLSQTVISLFLFYGYGLGLVGKLGPAVCLLFPLGIFAVQMVWSGLWLSHFRFGPVEWVWRSLTYGKAQPLRQPSAMPEGGRARA